jgi:Domain of unknown function (DUF4421)
MVCKQPVVRESKVILLVMVTSLTCLQKATAQQLPDHDSLYYQSFAKFVTVRFYFSQKYTTLELEKDSHISRFRYLPNTSLNAGIGATYNSLTLNLGYGFGFLNPDTEKGKTKYLDLQSHIYGRKWTIDLFGQFYKGYYLSPKGLGSADSEKYYIRPDIKISLAGAAVYNLLNPDKFSYRAALLQNEKQKKSAGSFLAGVELYYGSITADSSWVPLSIANQYQQRGVKRLRFFKFGPGAGYAYSLVMGAHFFLTGSLTGNLSVDYSRQEGGNGKETRVSVSPGYIYRIVLGYDNGDFNINASLVGNQLSVKSSNLNNRYFINTGNFRLTLAKKMMPGPKLKKRLHPIDRLLEQK